MRSCVQLSATLRRSCNLTDGLVGGVEAHISAIRAWCLAARDGAVRLVVLVVPVVLVVLVVLVALVVLVVLLVLVVG